MRAGGGRGAREGPGLMSDGTVIVGRRGAAGRVAVRWPWPWRPDPAVPLLALLPLLVFAAQATGRAVFAGHDIQYYFYPYHLAAARVIAGGHPPLWNPYAFSGLPLLGDGQTALLYPPNWLFLVPGLNPAVALTWAILLQFIIAALGTYGFARALGLWRLPAFVAAVAYAFGGFMTARIVHLSIMSGAALLPVVLLGVERALRPGPRRARWTAFAAVAAGLQLVAGHPQVPLYTLLAVGLLVAARAVERAIATRRPWPLALLPLRAGGIVLLGAALAAVQLLPWFELVARSPRAAGASWRFVFERSKVGADWLLLLFPYLFGALRPGPYGEVAGIGVGVRLWEQSSYVGILPLALAAIGLAGLPAWRSPAWRARLGSLGFLLALLLVGVVLAAGENTPFAEQTYAIPVLGRLRDVERAVVLASLALALLAGFGLQRLIEAGAGVGGYAWRIGLLPVATGIVVAPLIVARLASWPELPFDLTDRGITLENLQLLRLDRANAQVPLALAAASAFLLLGWPLVGPPGRRVLPYAAAALVLLDLAAFATAFHPSADPRASARVSPLAAALREDPGRFRVAVFLTHNALGEREAQDRLAVSWAMAYGIQDVNGFNSLQPRRYTDYLFGPDKADVSYGHLRDERLLADDSPVLSALNVKYLVVPKDADPQPRPGASFRLIWEDGAARVYENARVYPRAYLVERARHEPDDAATLAAVTAPGFDGRREALVAGAGAATVPDRPLAAGEGVAVVAYAPDRLVLRATADVPRLLVLSEMDYPGWRARVDGAATPVQRVNYLYRGVVLPPGEHTVEFVYRPASVGWGAAISGLAWVVVALLVGWSLAGGEVARRVRGLSPARQPRARGRES